jgi:peptide chain release factor 2
VDSRLLAIEEKEQISLDPNFWNDPEKAEGVLREIKTSKRWVEGFQGVFAQLEDLEVIFDFQKEGEATEEEVNVQFANVVEAIDDLEFRSTLNRQEDELGCLLEINAGAGGTEACDWVTMLLRMYQMWAEKSGYKVAQLNSVEGDAAGLRNVEIEIVGEFAYGLLKGENGVHRLVRVSPFNSQGKRMTSFASVFVHPVIDNRIEVVINPSDLSWDVFRSTGAGGQHVNTTDSAVRVRHAPSGLVVECQQERSQIQNRETALKMLKSKLYELELQKQYAEREKVEAGKTKNEWGSQIRSYVLDDRRVKDHRTGFTNNNTDAVLNGDIQGFLKAWLMNGTEVDVEE